MPQKRMALRYKSCSFDGTVATRYVSSLVEHGLAVPRVTRGSAPRMPSEWKIGELGNGRIEGHNLLQTDNRRFPHTWIFQPQELPGSIVRVVADMEDWRILQNKLL